ncbi:MAG TPA: heavy metal translocating P-type ATPase [Nitrososphaera sp.]|nr:heavy metal translocating P-type ATPase [Nitrososphaera sp.]
MSGENRKQALLKIGGMHCAGCVNSIQRRVSLLSGVDSVQVNLANERAVLEYDASKIGLESIEKAIEQAGYQVIYEKMSLVAEGISDSSDAMKLETTLRRLEGVKTASVNYGNSQIRVEYNPAAVSVAEIRTRIADAGYKVLSESSDASAQDIEAARLRKLFFLGLALTVPAVIFSYPEVFGFIPLAGTDAAAYLAFGCASLVQFLVGFRFYSGAFRIARLRSANMDTLVVLGTTAAFLFSAFNTFPTASWHGIYYDASTLVITFILLGKYLEIKTKGRTSSIIKKMLELQPKTAIVKRADGTEIETPVEFIKAGDVILVRPGDRIPVDAEVIQGESAVDESLATGESVPVRKGAGDSVLGASINSEGVLLVKATRVGAESFLAQVVRLVEDAMGKKPPIQKLVDKVGGYFAFAVMAVAATAFLAWLAYSPGDLGAATIPAVAILVVACPCALGLATPTAIIVGMGKAASNGVLFKSGEAIETLSKVKVAIFDKTGTLTEGKPVVTDILQTAEVLSAGHREESYAASTQVLELAATAEQWSEHPLAKAILREAKSKGIQPANVKDFQMTPGMGVTAVVNGEGNSSDRKVRVGSPEFMQSQGIEMQAGVLASLEKLQHDGKTAVLISQDATVIGIVGMQDTPKAGAHELIARLKEGGIEPVMITGDNLETANVIAKSVGISRVYAGVLPSGKVELVRTIQKEGKRVVMIGDGFNDAPALTAADVGIAMGAGTDLAIESGGVVLVRDEIGDVITAIEIARKVVSKIKQNLIYAFMYNAVLVPVAAFGMLYPALAGLAMAASSVSVTASSLSLKRWSPKRN